MAFAEEYDDGMEELLLDSIVAGAAGLHEKLNILHIFKFLHILPARCPIPKAPSLIKTVVYKPGGKQMHQNPPVSPQMSDNRMVIDWPIRMRPIF